MLVKKPQQQQKVRTSRSGKDFIPNFDNCSPLHLKSPAKPPHVLTVTYSNLTET